MALLRSISSAPFLSVLVLLHLVGLRASASTLPVGFEETTVGTGWNEPVGIAFDPDQARANRAYVWERGGTVWMVENRVKQPVPLIDISEEVVSWRDLGLLGFAIHPDFSQNGYVYLFYIVDRHHLLFAGTPSYDPAASELSPPTIGRITRYTVRSSDGFRSIDSASRKVLVGETKSTGIPVLNETHSVGTLAFATDGTLLASTGDGGSFEVMDDGGDVGNSRATMALADGIISTKEDVGAFRSQLIDSLSGKILRIDPETGNGVASNPFYDAGAPRAPRSRVWALGLRNPYRFTIRPNSGSHDPAAGNPGVLVVGDVGWSNWEAIHVVRGAGQNCGWPLFEGLTNNTSYYGSNQVNLDAPNPLGGHFRFRDLIAPETTGTPLWPNPIDPQQQVLQEIPHFMHVRPVIDYGRNFDPPGPVRTGIFNDTIAAQAVIGEPDSPVAGPQFQGNCSTGGTFYEGTDFPALYQGTYFHADYGKSWIKNIVLGADHRPIEMRDFAEVETPVFVTTHPTTGGIYYASFVGNVVRRIDYAPNGNRVPVAKAAASERFGVSPFTTSFSSAGSSDPEGTALTYLWTFGDGTTSTEANPSKTFAASGATRFDVILRVTDEGGAFAETTIPVFVNHTPPNVEILSPVDGTKYALEGSSTYGLVRRATAAPGHETSTRWQLFLHHDEHKHPEPPVDATESSAVITPVHSDTSTFYYRVVCTVTDDLGASTERVSLIVPNESNTAPQIAWSISSQNRPAGAGLLPLDSSAMVSDADSHGFEFGRLQISSSVADDTFSLLPQGDGPTQVNVIGSSVRYGGISVGTVSGGASNQQLIIDFASTATPAIAQSVLRCVGLQCSSGGIHTITASLADGDGATSAPVSIAVQVEVAPQPPSVSIDSPATGTVFTSPVSIVLAATASDPDGTVAKVEFFSGETKLGEDLDAPFALNWPNVPAGLYSVTARATDNSGEVSISAPIVLTVQPNTVLPEQWKPRDVGAAEIPGGTQYADGVFMVESRGVGYSTSDSFHFVTQAVDGDCEIVAHLASLQGGGPDAMAGVMVRESRGAGARHAFLALRDGSGSVFQWRAQPSALVRQRSVGTGAAPQWLRVVRRQTRCTASVSVDGQRWTQVWTVALLLPSKVFVGLGVSSGADGSIARASFDHVAVSPLGLTAQPPVVELTNPATASTFVAPGPIAFDVATTDPDNAIARVDLFRGQTKLGSDTKAPFSFVWGRATPGTHTFVARAVDFDGLQTRSSPVTITVQPVPTTLPAPWELRDLGNALRPGAADFGNGSFTVTSAGDDLFYKTDQGAFVWQSWTGDGTVIARVASVGTTTPTSLGGVVFRENLAANARSFAAVINQGEGARFHARADAGVDSEAGSSKPVTAPQWLRVTRRGNRFAAAISADGATWKGLGSREIAMSANCRVGLIVCAGPGGKPTTVLFDHVTVSATSQ